jgi:lipid-A-disaccharide synthase
VRTIASLCERVLVIFPFETGIYRRAGARVSFVGHPFLDLVRPVLGREEALRSFGLDPGRPLLLLLPGSRLSEVKAVFPAMARTARRLAGEIPHQAVVYAASEGLADHLAGAGFRVCRGGDKYGLFAAADFALAAAGSVTLELTLLGTPFLLLYRLSALTYAVLRPLVRVPYAGITNILAGRAIVPEFIQGRCRSADILPAARRLAEDRVEREAMRRELLSVRGMLGEPGAAERAAREILACARGETGPIRDEPG